MTFTSPRPSHQSPIVPGLPVIGNSLNLLYDPLSYLVEQYQQRGPVFRMQMGVTNYTVMAGIEANKFLASEGERVFSSESLFGGMARELETDVMITALDGPPHRHMRRLQRPGFARSAAHPHLAAMLDVVADRVADWPVGGDIPVMENMRRIIVDQIGLISTGFTAGDYFDDILVLINTLLNVESLKVWPKFMLKRPRYKQARRNVVIFGREILAEHARNPKDDMVGHMLANTRPDGKPFTEPDMISFVIGAFFAGMDTVASTMGFLMYALHKDPDVLAEVRREVAECFADGTPDISAIDKLPYLNAVMLETLRLYPVAPFTPRVVTVPFEFGGYAFTPGTEVMVAQTVTHLLPEYYPDPYHFDVTRHLDGAKSRIPHVFTPYSLGNHTCLGAGLAERQIMVTAAALVHYADFALPTPDYTVKIHTMPLPNPGRRFTLHVTANRAAVERAAAATG